ncbi:unnamed protein product [Paramecium sonneborni]|uniref:MORN repeat protein n=1 Tax=Paramecium sonneborni TaxID=65129 RepID=A0A8S1RUY6_9CILI|nr:unnamed protein product [Paramecium sonneborni]
MVNGLLFGMEYIQLMLADIIKKDKSMDYGKIYFQTIRAQIFEIGEYHNDFRIGRWNYISQDGKIGGGSYNKEGWKLGKWIELDEGFNDDKKVTYHGEYNINGMKVGRWDIMYCKYNEKEYKQIGGGSYDQEGNQKKIGKWVELDEEFCCDSEYVKQITYNGQYNMNGMKVGRWDIMYCRKWEMKYTYIGGGSYDLEGNQKKIGKWVELDEEFCCDSDFVKKIIYNGQYNMNGMKVGRWDTMYCENEEYQQSGGGSYDLEGNQQKIGKWVELDEEFNYWKQVTYIGEYNMNNMKVGRWDTMHCENEEYQQILFKYSGGGSYDQEGNQKKIGKWVELFEGFFCYAKVIYNGEYNMDGMKVGKWDIMYCKREEQEYKQIIFKYLYSGGGSYDQEGNQKKIGKWIELNERFYYSSESHFNQIIYIGEYNNNGQKAGIWVEIDIYFNNKIGEKRYDD